MEQIRKSKKQNVIILLCCACLYCLNRFWLKKAIQLPVIGYVLRCHFNDFLAGIAILAYINVLLSISKYHEKLVATYSKGFIISFLCGLIWEYFLPMFFSHGTSDFVDVISYVLGGITYIGLTRIIWYRTMYKRKDKL